MLQSIYQRIEVISKSFESSFGNQLNIKISRLSLSLFACLGPILSFIFLPILYAICFSTLVFCITAYCHNHRIANASTTSKMTKSENITGSIKISEENHDPEIMSLKIAQQVVSAFRNKHTKKIVIKILHINDIPKTAPKDISYIEIPTRATFHRVFVITKKSCPFQTILGKT